MLMRLPYQKCSTVAQVVNLKLVFPAGYLIVLEQIFLYLAISFSHVALAAGWVFPPWLDLHAVKQMLPM